MPSEELILYRLDAIGEALKELKVEIKELWTVADEVREGQAELHTKVEVNRARIMFFSTGGGTILGALAGLASSAF